MGLCFVAVVLCLAAVLIQGIDVHRAGIVFPAASAVIAAFTAGRLLGEAGGRSR